MPVFLDGQQNLAALIVPGVYGDIILPTPLLLGTPTNIEGLVGVASWGPKNALIPISKPTDAALVIGPPVVRNYDVSSYISASSQVGGSIGYYAVRVSDGTDLAASVTIQSGAAQATGTITVTSNAIVAQNMVVNGTTVTAGTNFVVGPNLATTVQNLLTYLQGAIADAGLNKMTYTLTSGRTDQITCTSVLSGAAGNAYTLTVGSGGAVWSVSGATLTGGVAAGSTCMTLSGKYTGSLGNKISTSIQLGSLANSYMISIAFPGASPEQINNVPGPTPATGTATFTASPAPADTLTIATQAITFVASGATTYQVNIGATLAITMSNLLTVLTGLAAANDPKIGQCTYSISASGVVLNLTANQTFNTGAGAGASGNSIALTKSSTAITVSGATLTGGVGTWNTFWVNLANAINNGNQYSRPSVFTVATAGAGIAPPTLSNQLVLSGGTDGASGVVDSILLGQDVVPRTGMFVLRRSQCDCFTLCDLGSISMYAAIYSFALSETMGAILGTVSGDTIAGALATRINSASDTPWLWLIMGDYPSWYDSYNGLTRVINPSAFGIGIVGNLSPQQSPLNKPLQGITSTQRSALGSNYSDAELSLINQGGIDTILGPQASPGGYYFSFASGRNTSSNTAANGVEYTRMTNFLIRTSQSKAAGSFVGRLQSIQPNDQTRSDAKSLFDGLSAQLASSQVGLGIGGQGMIDIPWLVQCDLLNNPPNLQALGYLFLYWQVRYLNVVRYFVVKFQGGGNVTVNVQNTPPSPTQFSQSANVR